MAARTLANLGLKAFFTFGEDGWNDEVDANFLKLSVLVQAGAVDVVSIKPTSPNEGDVYIINANATSNPNTIAVFDDGSWKHYVPQHGWAIYNRASDSYYMWSGSAWTVLPLANLRALGALNATSGVVEQNGIGSFAKRPVGVASPDALLTRSDGDTRYATAGHTHPQAGVTSFNTRTGAVTLTKADVNTALGRSPNEFANIDGIAALSPEALGVIEKTGDGAFTTRSVDVENPLSLLTIGLADSRYGVLSPILTGLSQLSSNATGLVEQTGTNSFSYRAIGGDNNEDVLTRGFANGLYIAKDNFTLAQLDDVPDDYTGKGRHYLALNDGATAFDFRAVGQVADINDYSADTTLSMSDMGALVRVFSAAGAVLTIPNNDVLPMPIGARVEVTQVGHGKITFNTGSSVAFDFLAGKTHRTQAQNAVVLLTKTDLNTWLLSGDLDTAGAASFSVDNLMVTADATTITVDVG